MPDCLEETVKELAGKEKPLKRALIEGGTGYFSEENLQEAAKRGINVLIPEPQPSPKGEGSPLDPQFRRRDPYSAGKKKEKVPKKRYSIEDFRYNNRKYKDNFSEKMRKKIDNPAYRELYSRRMQIVEPVYANITYCKGMNRFTLRTQKKVSIQWKLFCMVHNIGKCIKPPVEKYG